MKNNAKWKFPKTCCKVCIFFIFLLSVQLTYLSLSKNIYGINMKDFAASRNTITKTLTATRGNIYDNSGNILAQNVTSYTVIAYLAESRTTNPDKPNHVVDKKYTAEQLSSVLGGEVSYYENLLNKDLYQVEFGKYGKDITELKKDEIKALELPGIDFVESTKRFYPNGDFASYVIGYVKEYETYDESNNLITNAVGELGIEAKYNELLSGTDGILIYQKDRNGYRIPDTKEERIEALNGKDIYLTIDANIQRFVEDAVKDASEKYSPEWMMFTVMDAKTGDVLATSSSPSFDPNLRNIVNYENPFVSFTFEPGSTMKTYTYMCAMEKGKYNGDETYMSGEITIGEYTVRDWNYYGWGEITLDKGFEYSSNIGATYLVRNKISKEDLRECLEEYGFGSTTGIELSREATGKLGFNYEIEVSNASFGQGITTTAIQHLQALTLISNNGKMLKPHLVEKIVDTSTNEVVYQKQIEESKQKISLTTVNKMKDLMYNTVNGTDASTTGAVFRIDGFDVIGKTGTAQIYDPVNGGYLRGENDYIYSFAGMYPKENPEIIIYAAMKKPAWAQSAGVYTSVRSVMQSIAKYKNMFTEISKEEDLKEYTLKSYTSKDTILVKNELEEKGINVVLIGNGNKIINQYPNKDTKIIENSTVFLVTNDKEIMMPNMIGWSRREVQNYCDLTFMECNFNGYGYVTSQSIEKGNIINNDMVLDFELKGRYSFIDNPEMVQEIVE